MVGYHHVIEELASPPEGEGDCDEIKSSGLLFPTLRTELLG